MFEPDPDHPNVWPGRYRHVAVTSEIASFEPDALRSHLLGREVYHRTRYLVMHRGDETALAEVEVEDPDGLFTHVVDVRLLAGPEECRFVVDPTVDVGIPSRITDADPNPGPGAVIVEGRYGHLSFVLRPAPLDVDVHDVLDPEPSKLIDQVERVLDVAEDLPPIRIRPRIIDIAEVLAADRPDGPADVLLPCRGSGIVRIPATLHHLDERPQRMPWVLLGCERSQQIHRHFYGERADMVDVCPRRFLPTDVEPGTVLSRCCLLQEGHGDRRGVIEVPWGASLAEVRTALEVLVERATASGRFRWRRT